MKKHIAIIAVVMIMITIFSGTGAYAAESGNNTVVTQNIHDILGSDPNNTFEIYNGGFIYCFANNYSIEEMLADNIVISSYFVVFTGNKHVVYSITNNTANKEERMNKAADFFYEGYSDTVKDLLASEYDATINNIFFLSGAESTGHLYVYYQTDNGNYVLFRENMDDTESYLVPEEEFCSFSKDIWDNYRKELFRDGEVVKGQAHKSIRIPTAWNKYRVKSNSLVIVICALGLGACIIAAAFAVVRRRKHKQIYHEK